MWVVLHGRWEAEPVVCVLVVWVMEEAPLRKGSLAGHARLARLRMQGQGLGEWGGLLVRRRDVMCGGVNIPKACPLAQQRLVSADLREESNSPVG